MANKVKHLCSRTGPWMQYKSLCNKSFIALTHNMIQYTTLYFNSEAILVYKIELQFLLFP